MTPSDYVRVFDSQGEDYTKAFQVFLDSTDQKRNAKRFLQKLVDDLPSRKGFIDAGAGTGEVTKSFAPFFERTIAIEPNVHLLAQLQGALPQADAIATSILEACPAAPGDLVLCSHTLYYIPASEWLTHLERLVGWMSSTGLTVVILQNRRTDCMTMLEHFCSHRAAACTVAEFMLNLLPITRPPTRRDLEAYVDAHFVTGDGLYRLSVHQDFLEIRQRR